MAKSYKTSKRSSPDPSRYQPSEEVLAHFNLAEQSYTQGDFLGALEIYRRILGLDKYFLIPLKQMALCELQVNAPLNAIKHLEKYLKPGTKDPEACAYLAQAYLMTSQPGKAKQSIGKAIKLAQTADLYFLAASIEEQLNAPEKAIIQYERGLNLAPNHANAKLALGTLHKNAGNYNRAIELYEETLSNEPDNTNVLANLGNVYHALGMFEQAIECYEQARQLSPNADIAYNLGLSLQRLSRPTESLKAFRAALALEPIHLDAQFQIAECLSEQGLFDDAEEVLDSLTAANPNYLKAWYAKSQNKKFGHKNSETERKLLELSKQNQNSEDSSLAHFGLAKIYDDTERYDAAFEHFVIANKRKAKTFKHAAIQQLEQLSNPLLALDDADWQSVEQDREHPTPIFIIGMPRSGTTLLERNISRADEIAPCGEIDYFGPALFRITNKLGEFRDPIDVSEDSNFVLNNLKSHYLKRVDSLIDTSDYFIDKTPDNFRLVPALERLFPNAKFIHCQRNPLDTCLSIFFQNFESVPYSYDLANIAAYYLRYHKIIEEQRASLANKDKWLDVVYEDYVADELQVTESISAFLGIEFAGNDDHKMKSETVIRTMSKWQARQGVHQNSVGRWESYREKLNGIENALSSVL